MTKPSRYRKLIFGLLAMVIFIAVVEGVARIAFTLKFKGMNTSLSVQGNSIQASDPVLIFRNRPYYTDFNFDYQNNEEGFKSAPGDYKMPKKTANEFWVFLFGASAMEGMGSNKDGEWLDITGQPDWPHEKTIATKLESELKHQFHNRKIRVFNAANSGFTIWQSLHQYQRLKEKYAIDYVISMDGVNELLVYDTSASLKQSIEEGWAEAPIYHKPLRYVIPITRSLAIAYWPKQILYSSKMKMRLKSAKENNFSQRSYWLKQSGFTHYGDSADIARRTRDTFFFYLKTFDSVLTKDGIPHKLFIQPHLTLKDPQVLSDTEKALLHYYQSSYINKGIYNEYIKLIHESVDSSETGSISRLGILHRNNFETFVDYCHFTESANDQLAQIFANEIATYLSNKP